MERFAIKGNICYSEKKERIRTLAHSYVVCQDGKSVGVFETLPEEWKGIPCRDYGDSLILPGLIDLHVHGPQYPFRGLGMDQELIDWLNMRTFPEEEKYQDIQYAQKAYGIFTEELLRSATTRACIFATCHKDATLWLMEKLEETGFAGYVGKVNMDRNSPKGLCEASAREALGDTEDWIWAAENFSNIKPILTPRFIPTCSDELMEGLSHLQKKYRLPAQSHLSENLSEIQWVRELCPQALCYGDAYRIHGLFGGDCPTVMAHCVYSSEEEIQMMKEQKVFVAHCPESNANLASGIAPARQYLDMGLKMGLGTDVAAGTSLSMFRAMAMAIQCSKLRWRLVDQSLAPLTVEEVFFLATKGGGEFFGKVGSLEAGYEFDAVVIDDGKISHGDRLSVKERLERLVYLAEDGQITAKYIKGRQVLDTKDGK
ncbi:MAG: amidohydrolase family protein [Blautia sp.]|jgi:guanine deaminase